MTQSLFVVANNDWPDNYSVQAVFSTREKAEAWARNRNAQAVEDSGVVGLSCQSRERAAEYYRVEDYQIDLDPEPQQLITHAEQLARYGRGEFAKCL